MNIALTRKQHQFASKLLAKKEMKLKKRKPKKPRLDLIKKLAEGKNGYI